MDKLSQYRVFVQVAEMGSFVKASHALKLPRASVSAAIQELEMDLGTRLLHRTTRQVQLTTDGMQLLERLRPFLAEAENIGLSFQADQRQVSGCLSVDMPSRIARRLVAPALPDFLQRYPHLQLTLSTTDRMIDLVQEGVDCAVRVGELQDSSLVAHHLGKICLINCASPAYLSKHGAPEHPADLTKGHYSVGYISASTGRELPWAIQYPAGEQVLPVPSQVIVNNAENYIACCLAGLGLIQIPRFDVEHLLFRGQLVEVMPEYRAASMPVSLIYPHRRQRSRRLNAFIEWFADLMQPALD
jgi:DNA-binding transcriptional LysR family regulator